MPQRFCSFRFGAEAWSTCSSRWLIRRKQENVLESVAIAGIAVTAFKWLHMLVFVSADCNIWSIMCSILAIWYICPHNVLHTSRHVAFQVILAAAMWASAFEMAWHTRDWIYSADEFWIWMNLRDATWSVSESFAAASFSSFQVPNGQNICSKAAPVYYDHTNSD